MIAIAFLTLCASSQALRLQPERVADADEVGTVRCLTCSDAIDLAKKTTEKSGCGPQNDIQEMWSTVTKLKPVSDKFTAHTYQTMYGTFLMPWRTSQKGPKLLEIGLGCGMSYGAGASVQVWKKIVPQVELWEADYNKACVDKARQKGQLKGVDTVTGDQGNATVVDRWVEESGGHFDIVIDDGGHANTQIKTSFDRLWPHVNPGGLYFLEDLHVGRNTKFDVNPEQDRQLVMSDIIQTWTDQILISAPKFGNEKSEMAKKFPIPKDVEFIFCQHEACVLGKTKYNYKGKEWE